MIFRLLFLFLIVWFLIWIIRKQFSTHQQTNDASTTEKAEDMLACDYCGTHVPSSLAILENDKTYCCSEHAKLDEE